MKYSGFIHITQQLTYRYLRTNYTDNIAHNSHSIIHIQSNDRKSRTWNLQLVTMEDIERKNENISNKEPIWMDNILPHNEYFDADVAPLGLFRDSPFCHLQKREVEIEGKKFNSCEQFIQAKKAIMFGDMNTWNKIMKETNPKVMKQRAKEIRNVQEDVWNGALFDIYTQANYHKFQQNTDLKVLLLSTGNKLLVQCNDVAKPPRIGLTREKSEKRRLNESSNSEIALTSQRRLPDRTNSRPLTYQEYTTRVSQNAHIMKTLCPEKKSSKSLSTNDSSLDKIRENEVQDIRRWDKKNILGQSLMMVRKKLMNEEQERKMRLLDAMNLHKELDGNQ